MNYLLDTCAFIDMLFAPDKLSKSASSAIEATTPYTSALFHFGRL